VVSEASEARPGAPCGTEFPISCTNHRGVILSEAAWGPASFCGVSGAKDLLLRPFYEVPDTETMARSGLPRLDC
jgi:hypothetical protein